MKISDLIRKLEILKEKHGDNELEFGVKDHYSRYTETATLPLKVGEDKGGFNWFGCYSNNGITRLHIHLSENYEGKQPKITFRK